MYLFRGEFLFRFLFRFRLRFLRSLLYEFLSFSLSLSLSNATIGYYVVYTACTHMILIILDFSLIIIFSIFSLSLFFVSISKTLHHLIDFGFRRVEREKKGDFFLFFFQSLDFFCFSDVCNLIIIICLF